MRIFDIQKSQSSPSYQGTPQRMYGCTVRNYQDALKWWENLRFSKYLDAHCNDYYDKAIRADNYSFLDKLTTNFDKQAFIQKFCEFTKFPNLREISSQIDSTFKSCIENISQTLNYRRGDYSHDIIDFGYDPTCSLGLRKAFPGSDLDKGYIILKGTGSAASDENIVNNFKGELWDNLDQRIVSLNHPDTFPSVYTKAQVKSILSTLDKKANEVEQSITTKAGIATFIAITAATLLGPAGIIGGSAIAGALLGQYFKKQATTTDPYKAARFNREIAKRLTTPKDKEMAKNFAFCAEIINSNLDRKPAGKTDSFFTDIKNSPFIQNSNVTQVNAWLSKINGGYMKSKLRNREKLEHDFCQMSTDTKYELIKDIIKYCTDDQSYRFSEYFKNDDDIANRYHALLESLK